MGRGDKPGQDEWSQNRKADRDIPGYAPRPRGGVKPVQLGTTRAPNAMRAVWRPGYGWMPAYRVGTAGKLVTAARGMAEGVGSGLKEALRNTAKSAMSPLGLGGAGGGGDPKSQKKK